MNDRSINDTNCSMENYEDNIVSKLNIDQFNMSDKDINS